MLIATTFSLQLNTMLQVIGVETVEQEMVAPAFGNNASKDTAQFCRSYAAISVVVHGLVVSVQDFTLDKVESEIVTLVLVVVIVIGTGADPEDQ